MSSDWAFVYVLLKIPSVTTQQKFREEEKRKKWEEGEEEK